MSTTSEQHGQEGGVETEQAPVPSSPEPHAEQERKAILEEIERMRRRFTITGKGPGWGVWQ